MATIHSKKVFLCQSVLFAFIDRAHPQHAIAEAYFRHFAENGYQLYSNDDNVITCYSNIRRHMSITIGKEFLRALLWGSIEVIRLTDAEAKDALKLLSNNTDPNYRYQDALIAVLCYRRNILQIATFDQYQAYFGQNTFSLPM